jgi:hypothetical protein
MTRRATVAAALALALGLSVCSDEPADPEARVRAVLAALEQAAEAQDVAALKEQVSEEYADARGNDKRALAALASFHLLRNRSVHLLMRVRAVELPAPGEARVLALVAMAGRPLPEAAALAGVRADLYAIHLDLRDEDGEWRIVAADWQPATADDFR